MDDKHVNLCMEVYATLGCKTLTKSFIPFGFPWKYFQNLNSKRSGKLALLCSNFSHIVERRLYSHFSGGGGTVGEKLLYNTDTQFQLGCLREEKVTCLNAQHTTSSDQGGFEPTTTGYWPIAFVHWAMCSEANLIRIYITLPHT